METHKPKIDKTEIDTFFKVLKPVLYFILNKYFWKGVLISFTLLFLFAWTCYVTFYYFTN